MEISLLPEEVLPHIFQHLRNEDVKACRLVNRTWYNCCRDSLIANRQKFTFHRIAYFIDKINSFLVNCERTRLNVEFTAIPLQDLDWQRFGDKVRWLKIVDCEVNVEILTNLFLKTPNLQYVFFKDLRVIRSKGSVAVLEATFDNLRGNNFENENLRTFRYHGMSKFFVYTPASTFLVQKVCELFPYTNSIDFSLDFRNYYYPQNSRIELNKEQNNITRPNVGSSIRELSRCKLANDFLMRPVPFVSVPKLKKLDIEIPVNLLRSAQHFSSISNFFSEQIEFETLLIYLKATSTDDEHENEFMLPFLFIILRNCKSLKKLLFVSNCYRKVSLDKSQAIEFCLLLYKLREFTTTNIIFDINTFYPSPMGTPVSKLKRLNLRSFDMKTLDVPPELSSLEHFSFIFDDRLHDEGSILLLSNVLRSLKNLRTLTATFYMIEITRILEPTIEHHEKLERFVLNGLVLGEYAKDLFLMNFPNLLEFDLTGVIIGNLNRKEEISQILLDWLAQFQRLRSIHLKIKLPGIQCIEFFKRMTRLQTFSYIMKDHINYEEVLEFFVTSPSLKYLNIVDTRRTTNFYYFRPENLLFVAYRSSGCFTLVQ